MLRKKLDLNKMFNKGGIMLENLRVDFVSKRKILGIPLLHISK